VPILTLLPPDASPDAMKNAKALAEQHFADFRIQVTRLSGGTQADIIRQCMDLENSVGWALTRLRREPRLDRTWHEFARFMAGVGERVHGVERLGRRVRAELDELRRLLQADQRIGQSVG
jgi:hypothetical protein